MNEIKTLTGKTMDEVRKHFARLLPADAYDKVPGGANLTDIAPIFFVESMTEMFGMAGVGWWYEYLTTDINLAGPFPRKSASGRQYEVYIANVTSVALKFRYTFDGSVCVSEAIASPGSSENERPGDAMKGAITNALSKCGEKLLWQMEVYKGHVDHNNAGALNKKQAEAAATKAATPAAASAQPAQTASKPVQAPSRPVPTPAAPALATKTGSSAPTPVRAAVERPEVQQKAEPALPATPQDDEWEEDPTPTQVIELDITLDFGQNKGKKLSQCPRDYVEWLANGSKRAQPGSKMATVQDTAAVWLAGHPAPQTA